MSTIRPVESAHPLENELNTRNSTIAALLLAMVCLVPACGQQTVSVSPAAPAATSLGSDLDVYIHSLMTEADVKGLTIAVIEGDEISHLQSYGYRNVEQSLPLETDTIMYGASLTKAAFAYVILQLVDEGLIDLDRSIADYLDRPLPAYDWWRSLADDEEWSQLTARIILTHTTGLNNLRYIEKNQDLTFYFPPGEHYAYSGEGINILQAVVEEGLGLDLKTEMRKRLFDPFGMPNTSMQWREDFAMNLADGYAMDGSYEPHDERSNVSASGSMDTTIADQARMWRGMLAGERLSRDMRREWVRAQFPIRTAQKFPTIPMYNSKDPRGEVIRLAAGLGVETWQGPTGRYFAKGGHNDWTGNLVLCAEAQQRCLVMLANSVRAEIIFPEIVQAVLGDTGYPWWWTYPDLHGDTSSR